MATNAHFCPDRLERFLNEIVKLLQAEVLGRSSTSYQPQGASATVLIGQGEAALFHLDKSHLAVHTYFEANDKSLWGSFRCELELSTCGALPVRQVLGKISREYDFEVLMLDCKIRGFKRGQSGALELAATSSEMILEGMLESAAESAEQDHEQVFQIAGFSRVHEAKSTSGYHVALMAEGLEAAKRSQWERLLSASSPGS